MARELGMCSHKQSLILEAGPNDKGMRWRTPDEHTSFEYKAGLKEYETLFRKYDLCVQGMCVCVYVCVYI